MDQFIHIINKGSDHMSFTPFQFKDYINKAIDHLHFKTNQNTRGSYSLNFKG